MPIRFLETMKERRKLWREILEAVPHIEREIIRCGILVGKYRLATSAVEFRAELIHKQIERLLAMLDLQIPGILAVVRPRPQLRPWHIRMDAKYNPPRALDWIEQADRWLWLHIISRIFALPWRAWYRLIRSRPRGNLEAVRGLHAIMLSIVNAQEQLAGALDYALAPVINGRMTPITFRDRMLRGQKDAAERRDLEIRERQRLAAAEGRLQQAAESLGRNREAFAGLRIVPPDAVPQFLGRARAEIEQLKADGIESDRLIAVMDVAADILYNGYRHWAGEVKVVQDRLDHIMEVVGRLRLHRDPAAVMDDLSEATKFLDDEVRPAWAEARWDKLDAALQAMEKILRVVGYEAERALEQAQGGTDALLSLSYPREARRKEHEPTEAVAVGTFGTTVDPSLEATWHQGDQWTDKPHTEEKVQ